MPLSEHEQRQLEQMERALYAEDPKFASTMRGSTIRAHYRRRILFGAIGFILGVVLLMLGLVQNIALGVAGFVVMLLSVWLAAASWRRLAHPGDAQAAAAGPGVKGARKPGKTSFMQRLEERWNRRRDSRGI